MKAAQAARQNAQTIHESFIFAGFCFQHGPHECAAGPFWLVLGRGSSDRTETEQSQTLELLFACFSALAVPLGLRASK